MNLTAVKPRKDKPRRAWLSVGLKMMIGVGLFSNLCIGFLMVVNITAFSQIASKTNALMEMTSSMNQHLRSGIFDLQKKYLEIPKLLKTDASEEVLEWAKKTFTLEKEEILNGPD